MRNFSLNVQVRMTYAHMTDFWLDKIALELHHTKKLFYVIFGKTSLLWASKNAQYVQIFFWKKYNYSLLSATTFRNLQQPDLLQDMFERGW